MAIKVRDQDTFIQMDAADEQQILKEMEGEIVKDLYYDVNGKKGLSYVGVNHMSFKIGGIKIIPESVKVEYDKDTDEYVASVVACNEKYSLTRAGMSVQPKMMDVYDRSPSGQKLDTMHKEYDRFARIKALSKAQRNAIKAVMPEALIAAYLDYFIKLKQGGRTQQPRDEGPIGMKDPRKVDADFKVKDEGHLEKGAVIPPEQDGNQVDPVSFWLGILRENGLTEEEIGYLEMHDLGGYQMEIEPNTFLGDGYNGLWGRMNNIVRAQRGEWVKGSGSKGKGAWKVPY